jgi:outer membrane murein-binding lipoprotein Lpp
MVVGLMLLSVGRADGRNLETEIAAAQSRVVAASAEVEELTSSIKPVRSQLEAAEEHAAPARRRAKTDAADLGATKKQLRVRHIHAASAVRQVEAERRSAANEHDHRVDFDIGLAVAALIAAAIALAWLS